MSKPRYTVEFKAEAVKQVTDRGYSVAEVADRLGVSTHSLYAWLRAAGTVNTNLICPVFSEVRCPLSGG